MKLFGTPTSDHLAWEFSLMMRSGMQPFIVWCLGRVLLALGVYSPYLLIFVLQLLGGAFSVAALLVFGRAVRDELGDERQERIYLALGLLLWFLAYLHVHFSAEMMAGNMLLLLAAATLRYLSSDRRHEFRWGFCSGRWPERLSWCAIRPGSPCWAMACGCFSSGAAGNSMRVWCRAWPYFLRSAC